MRVIYDKIKTAKARKKGLPDFQSYLNTAKGVVHIGANRGQERYSYAALGLNVLWFEADPKLFRRLQRNIAKLKHQLAFHCLLSNETKADVPFFIANNRSHSSSMLELQPKGEEIWPGVRMEDKILLDAYRFDDIVTEKGLSLSQYDCLIMDVQGAELIVLEGMPNSLRQFKFAQFEASDQGVYEGGVPFKKLDKFMKAQGFKLLTRTELDRPEIKSGEHKYHYFEALYQRID